MNKQTCCFPMPFTPLGNLTKQLTSLFAGLISGQYAMLSNRPPPGASLGAILAQVRFATRRKNTNAKAGHLIIPKELNHFFDL